MQLRDYIRQNRDKIDAVIDQQIGHVPRTGPLTTTNPRLATTKSGGSGY